MSGRLHTGRPEIPLYHTFSFLSIGKINKFSIIFSPDIVHFDERMNIH